MNLRTIDLNLLVILDALLEEAHVTRAAHRLALSQPATSSALERCRQLFDDPLLQRLGGRMRLTARAEALRGPLKDALAGLKAALEAPAGLAPVSRSVRIAMADVPAALVLAGLHRRLQRDMPGLQPVLLPWMGADDALRRLGQGHVDLAVSSLPSLGGEFRRLELLRERYVVAMRHGHPAARSFDLDRWLAHPHVLVSSRGETFGALDDALVRHGRSRRVGMVVASFLVVPPLLEGSDLIAMLPRHCLPAPAAATLAVFEPPIPVEDFGVHAAWHARSDADAAVQCVVQALRAELEALVHEEADAAMPRPAPRRTGRPRRN
ncbi:LysR family transcriptional regulator [Eleftheria terrae]|uniref:LysR family transcriptional regulator n=1 Tax=Eleftheria terrae TaxID=1597781 RepID=UPI00263B5838|nr:LysR family transcriptional regulator [Eleftheria terrae]WKB52223.1 LysR substrate-binding domain-containing protein [Eleftheria terrae]